MVFKLRQKAVAVLSSLALTATLTPAAALAAETDAAGSQGGGYHQSLSKINTLTDDSVLGVDFSQYQQDLKWHKDGFFNYQYEPEENVFKFVKGQGVNTASVKVAVDPGKAKEPVSSYTLENAAKTIKAANAAGLKTNVVLMYSDGETFKGEQPLPSGWNSEVKGETLGETSMGGSETWPIHHAVSYTEKVIKELKSQGATPSMITIGNEINYDFLGYEGDDAWKGWMAMRYLAGVVKDSGIKVGFSLASKEGSPEDIQYPLEKLNDSWISCSYDYVGVGVYTYKGFDGSDYSKDALSQFEKSEKGTANEKAQFYLSSVKCPRKDDSDSSVTEEKQAKTIYGLLKATSDEGNAGGLIVDKGAAVGDYSSFFESDHALTSLATFAYAQGKKVDVSSTPSEDAIYKYGLESGLKDQKVNVPQINGMNSSAIRGVDISSYNALKKAGVKFYDNDGKECSLLKTLADNGVNYVRLRIWNDPYNSKGEVYGGGVCDVENDLEIAKEASKYGMKILLCFQYSDFWADPTIQQLPKAWKKDARNSKAVAKHVYDFTKDTVKRFRDAGCEVGMVQIGNEITNGLCETYGDYKKVWGDKSMSEAACSYLNAGAKAVRETAPNALVALQLESPNSAKYDYVLNSWKSHKVDYDVLGTSCYAFWSQTPERLTQVQNVAKKHGKLFCVLETSWVNTLKDADGTTNQLGEGTVDLSRYKVGVQGQVDVLADQYKALLSQPNGLGAFYWEPAWIPVKPGWVNWKYNKEVANKYGTGWASEGAVGYHPNSKLYYKGELCTGGSGWDNQSLFDFNGHPLQSLSFYKRSQVKTETQTTVIKIRDAQGNAIANDVIVKSNVGSSATAALPKVNGYKTSNYSIKVEAKTSGVVTQTVTYQPVLSAKVSKSSYAYNGKVVKPKVDVYFGGKLVGKSLSASNSKFALKYPSAKRVGTYSVKVTGKGSYKGSTLKAEFKIVPKTAKLSKVSSGKKKFKATWKKISSQNSGYQLQYANNKSFSSAKTKTVSSSKKISKTVTKLKSKNRYYVKVRTYKKVKGVVYYGSWSSVKSVKVK